MLKEETHFVISLAIDHDALEVVAEVLGPLVAHIQYCSFLDVVDHNPCWNCRISLAESRNVMDSV